MLLWKKETSRVGERRRARRIRGKGIEGSNPRRFCMPVQLRLPQRACCKHVLHACTERQPHHIHMCV